jgi:hypothetical protein
MEVFAAIDEVVLETISDSCKPYYTTQWISCSIIRTLAKRNANIPKFTLVSVRQQGGDIMVTGAGDPYGGIRGDFPAYMLPVLRSVKTLRLEQCNCPDVNYGQAL